MIIAVDYDGTLNKNGVANAGLIFNLRAAQARGDTVILWTCREGKSLNEALTFLIGHGLRPNYVNSNAPETIQRFKHDPRKVYADIYIDDKAGR